MQLNLSPKVLLLTLAVCVSHFLIAQSIIPRFESLGVNDGLPHSSVYSILQDKKGFMWFGTADGLCRYDGSNLQNFKYKAANSQDVVNNFVRGKMLEDKPGNIYYCNESGIYKWDVIKEIVFRIESFDARQFKNANFQAIYLDDKASMWIFDITNGIVEYNITNGSTKQYPLPYKPNYSTAIFRFNTTDDAGSIWLRLGIKADAYLVFNKQSHKYSQEFTSNPPQAIFFNKKKRILAYEDKLVYEDEAGRSARIIPKTLKGRSVSFFSFDGIMDKYQRLWMTARGNGLFYYDEKNNSFGEYHHNNSKIKSLPFDLTTCLFIDRNENLWIGIDGGGVAKLDLKEPKFNLFPLSEGDFPMLNDYFTKCFYEDEKGRIWFGSQTNGLNIFDPTIQALTNYHHESGHRNGLPGNMVASIIKDRAGNIWIGSSGGISIFNEQKKTFKTVAIRNLPKLSPLINTFVYKIIELRNGDLLAATLQGIIKVKKLINGSFVGIYYNDKPHLISAATDVMEMPDNTIYATLPGIGLYKFKPEGDGYGFAGSSLHGIDLRSVRSDEKNPLYLWIGSGKGLIHYNTTNNTFRVWNEDDGIANSYVYGSLEDSTGNLWISTNKGLSFFNIQKNTFDNYAYQDGLQSNEFNTQSFYKSSTGVFYFGGIKGFNWFKPGSINKEQIKPVAAITKIEINDSVFRKDSGYLLHHVITVPYDKNDFNFQFASLDYTRPEANNIAYRLEGLDADWVIADNKSARYANLPPGEYLLKVKASNAEGIWSDEEHLKLVVSNPYWQQQWFYVLVILFLIAIIFSASYTYVQQGVRQKLRKLEKQAAIDAERNRISTDMHDEIGSGITRIALLSELIQTQPKDERELKSDINTIATSARKLVQTMSDIIWALSPQNNTLEDLLAYTREQSHQYFEQLEVEFEIDFPDVVPDIDLSNAERRNLYLVTREALNNAMKHSAASAIKLKLEITESEYCFTVTDNGTGISERNARASRSNGIRNMIKRMDDIGGTIDWLPREKGTTVQFCLPL